MLMEEKKFCLVGGFEGDEEKEQGGSSLSSLLDRNDFEGVSAVLDQLPFQGRFTALLEGLRGASKKQLLVDLFRWCFEDQDVEGEDEDFVLLALGGKRKTMIADRQHVLRVVVMACQSMGAEGVQVFKEYLETGSVYFRRKAILGMAGCNDLPDETLLEIYQAAVQKVKEEVVMTCKRKAGRHTFLELLLKNGDPNVDESILYLNPDSTQIREKIRSDAKFMFRAWRKHGAAYLELLEEQMQALPKDPLARGRVLKKWMTRSKATLSDEIRDKIFDIITTYRPMELSQGVGKKSGLGKFYVELSQRGELGESATGFSDVQPVLPREFVTKTRFQKWFAENVVEDETGQGLTLRDPRTIRFVESFSTWIPFEPVFEKASVDLFFRQIRSPKDTSCAQSLLAVAVRSANSILYSSRVNKSKRAMDVVQSLFLRLASSGVKNRAEWTLWINSYMELASLPFSWVASDLASALKVSPDRGDVPSQGTLLFGMANILLSNVSECLEAGHKAGWIPTVKDVMQVLARFVECFKPILRQGASTCPPFVDSFLSTFDKFCVDTVLGWQLDALYDRNETVRSTISSFQGRYDVLCNVADVVAAHRPKVFAHLVSKCLDLEAELEISREMMEHPFISVVGKNGERSFVALPLDDIRKAKSTWRSLIYTLFKASCQGVSASVKQGRPAEKDVLEIAERLWTYLDDYRKVEKTNLSSVKADVAQSYLACVALAKDVPAIISQERERAIQLGASNMNPIIYQHLLTLGLDTEALAKVSAHSQENYLKMKNDITDPACLELLVQATSGRDASERIAGHISLLAAAQKAPLEQYAEQLEFVTKRVKNEGGIFRRPLLDALSETASKVLVQKSYSEGIGCLGAVSKIEQSLVKMLTDDLNKRDSVAKYAFRNIASGLMSSALSCCCPEEAAPLQQVWLTLSTKLEWSICLAEGGEKGLEMFRWNTGPKYATVAIDESDVTRLSSTLQNNIAFKKKHTGACLGHVLLKLYWSRHSKSQGQKTHRAPHEVFDMLENSFAEVQNSYLSASGTSKEPQKLGDCLERVLWLVDVFQNVWYRIPKLLKILDAWFAPLGEVQHSLRNVSTAEEANLQARGKECIRLLKTLPSHGYWKLIKPYGVYLNEVVRFACVSQVIERRTAISLVEDLWFPYRKQEALSSFQNLTDMDYAMLSFFNVNLPAPSQPNSEIRVRVELVRELVGLCKSSVYLPLVQSTLFKFRGDLIVDFIPDDSEGSTSQCCYGVFHPDFTLDRNVDGTMGNRFGPFERLPPMELFNLPSRVLRKYSAFCLKSALSLTLNMTDRCTALANFLNCPATSKEEVISLANEIEPEGSLMETLLLKLFSTDAGWDVLSHLLRPSVIVTRPQRMVASVLEKFSKEVDPEKTVRVFSALLLNQSNKGVPISLQKSALRTLLSLHSESAKAEEVVLKLWGQDNVHKDLRFEALQLVLVRLANKTDSVNSGDLAAFLDESPLMKVIEAASSTAWLDEELAWLILSMDWSWESNQLKIISRFINSWYWRDFSATCTKHKYFDNDAFVAFQAKLRKMSSVSVRGFNFAAIESDHFCAWWRAVLQNISINTDDVVIQHVASLRALRFESAAILGNESSDAFYQKLSSQIRDVACTEEPSSEEVHIRLHALQTMTSYFCELSLLSVARRLEENASYKYNTDAKAKRTARVEALQSSDQIKVLSQLADDIITQHLNTPPIKRWKRLAGSSFMQVFLQVLPAEDVGIVLKPSKSKLLRLTLDAKDSSVMKWQ